jgi:transcriptional regulator with XRE-family HTH domain
MELTGIDLKRLRVKSGVSQVLLAKKLKVDRKTVRNWEEGIGQPSANQFFKICFICNINALLLVTRLASRKSPNVPLDTENLRHEDN